ncbi:beta-phosphoglucomutase [Enterococcus pseudoavium]|uniref:beta-phosphoglucomutase n=1 Tax=Enterococcus pseudoavium TaxID=44007 RepID=UPI00082CDE8E|nr:beta-phosphoglucomutase [Enterococcus pseudoavium]
MSKYLGAIFDLDGVLVDTAKYHFQAWKQLATQLGIPFTEKDNERLKGVSRVKSLEILLSLGNKEYSVEEQEQFLEQKNQVYVDYIKTMDKSEILPGVIALIQELKDRKLKIALGSASKNAEMILKNTELYDYFDVIVDGNHVAKAKPDPEVFLLGAEKMQLPAEACIVFEDAKAGIEAAQQAGMLAVGVGSSVNLPNADMVVKDLTEITVAELLEFNKKDGM